MDSEYDTVARVREIENEWIVLADGTRLAARIWLPESAHREPVPAVLEYLPYRKDDGTAVADARRHPYFAAHGYAAVRVDLRGTGDSDGLLRGEYLAQEQDDALEVLRWLASRSWCTGAVGMIGYSWGGFSGLQVAARRPRELKAVITIASTDDRYRDDCHYMGGCLLGSDMLKWAATMTAYTLLPPDPRYAGRRWRQQWLERLTQAPALARDWVAHQRRDAFWKHGSVSEDYGAIECPVLVVGGWADAYTNAVPRLLEHLRVPRLGIIGPWGHMLPHEGVPGPAIDFLRECVRWWDRWLKGIDNGMMVEPLLRCWLQDPVPPASFQAERPGRWIQLDGWPPSGRVALALAPGAGGVLSTGPSQETVLTIRGDQRCGETAGVWCANGYPDELAGDQDPDDRRSLTFTTEPLSSDVAVIGNPLAEMSLAVDQPLALVAVRLCDVAPDGSSLLVSWGLGNLTHDETHESAHPLVPGVFGEHSVELKVCGHRFPVGHRIRLSVSPTYWPHAWPSPHAVTLRMRAGGPSVVTLPTLAHSAETSPLGTFGPPIGPGAPKAGTIEGWRRRRHDVDPAGRSVIDDEQVTEHRLAHGVRYREWARDTYAIARDDPLSAEVICEREIASSGGLRPWSVSLGARMTADECTLFIEEEYSGRDRGAVVFRRHRRSTVQRDHV